MTVDAARLQRRVVRTLALGQVLGGIAFGATLSLGALLAADISGRDSLSGLATASVTLGAALCAIPLARMAGKRGRRRALTFGNAFALAGIALIVAAAALRMFPLLVVGMVLVGAGNAGNLQSRFAATDLAEPHRRGRDLSTVVWATTVGGVLGPLMQVPGNAVGTALGMPPLTGAYVFSFAAQIAALALYLVALRPDPLLTAQALAHDTTRATADAGRDHPATARFAIFAVAASHVTMASVMAMTPIHLQHLAHGMHGDESVTPLVFIAISFHVFGMYGLSPLFGRLADRIGRLTTILLGQGVLAVSLVTAGLGHGSSAMVLVGLFLLGVGWSASTVAGAALLTESTPLDRRPTRQGTSDTIMTATAAVGAVLAGVVLDHWGYGTLAFIALVFVVATTVASLSARRPA
ncbi:MAG: MFS transporter [Microbacterium sp.]